METSDYTVYFFWKSALSVTELPGKELQSYRNLKDAPLHLPSLLAPSLEATLYSWAYRGSLTDLETGKPTEIVKRITKEDLI